MSVYDVHIMEKNGKCQIIYVCFFFKWKYLYFIQLHKCVYNFFFHLTFIYAIYNKVFNYICSKLYLFLINKLAVDVIRNINEQNIYCKRKCRN